MVQARWFILSTGARIRDRIATSKTTRLAILLAGIITSQGILYGPWLIGARILLPVDLLAQPDVYIPVTPGTAKLVPHDQIQSDLAYVIEPERMLSPASCGRVGGPRGCPGSMRASPRCNGRGLRP